MSGPSTKVGPRQSGKTTFAKEVDFLLAESGKPFLLQHMLNIPVVQVVNKPTIHKILKNGKMDLTVVSAARWLCTLP